MLFSAFAAYSQIFAPLGAKWTFVQPDNYNHVGLCKYSDKIKSFEVYEERIIEGATYKVLRLDTADLLIYKEDSQRVYYYENDSVFLLMDFNLSVGDTLKVRFPSTAEKLRLSDCCYTPTDVPVYNVLYKDTTVTIAGRTLRQLHFESYYLVTSWQDGTEYEFSLSPFVYTERTGDYVAPLSLLKDVCCAADYCNDIFLCYQDNEWGYENVHAEYNCAYTSTTDKSMPDNTVAVYPNPADKTLNITNTDVAEVSIIHLDGRILFQKTFEHAAQINTEKLHSGLYYAVIKSQHDTVIKKIVVSH